MCVEQTRIDWKERQKFMMTQRLTNLIRLARDVNQCLDQDIVRLGDPPSG
jgi:hypothetical protein